MIYEDAENEFDAIAQAYGNICEIASDPSIGANYIQVINPDIINSNSTILLDEALIVHSLLTGNM
jgi:hypothetical protein